MWRYQVFSHVGYQEDLGSYATYGIRVEGETGEVVTEIQDVTTDRALAERIAQRCANGQLSPCQLHDFIEDSI